MRLIVCDGEYELTFAEEAMATVARKAIERKTGARGLRSIMESILLDTMFELPSLEGVAEVVITKQVVEGTRAPATYLPRPLNCNWRCNRLSTFAS
jgi:ATP-dependent protease Clp ATPase subunit